MAEIVDPGPPAESAGAWQSVMCRRRNRPPLRFKGVLAARHSQGTRDGEIIIELWQRKTPGFVVHLSLNGESDAASRDALEDAMGWLEAQCDRVIGPDSFDDLASLLQYAQRQIRARAALRVLAGQALDAWDRDLSETD